MVALMPMPLARWTFSGDQPMRAAGCGAELVVRGGSPRLLSEGGIRLAEGDWLGVSAPVLRLHGSRALSLRVRVCRERKHSGHCEAIAGVWDEERDSRAYAIFFAALEAKDRAVAHISATGGNAPGHDHCRSAVIGTTRVSYGAACVLGMAWDGGLLHLAVDGRPDAPPMPFSGPLFASAAEFTVGSVARRRPPPGPGNFFAGDILSIEVWDRWVPEVVGQGDFACV